MTAAIIETMIQADGAAAASFESRWTMRALRRVDQELCDAVEEQRQLFHEAIITGDDEQIQEHGRAMIRGWIAAAARMDAAKEPDDSYVIGQDAQSGTMVAIGFQRAAQARVRELHGDRVVWVTPDEVAAMFVGMQTVATVKHLWPGAEIATVKRVERYPDEPAQEDVP